MSKKRETDGCEANMTPMIDVVFQLIIFFIVTINMSDSRDPEVQLEFGKDGPEIEAGDSDAASALTIDVNAKGRMSLSNLTLNEDQLRKMVRSRVARQGNNFQLWVRGDYRARHDYIRKVMDICSAEGLGRVSFIAIKDARTPEARKFEQQVVKARK